MRVPGKAARTYSREHEAGRRMFEKPYADYVRYQAPILVAVAVVGLARLGLSLAGMPNSMVKHVSVTAVGFAGIFYSALRVQRTGFGSYRHMLPARSSWPSAAVRAGRHQQRKVKPRDSSSGHSLNRSHVATAREGAGEEAETGGQACRNEDPSQGP